MSKLVINIFTIVFLLSAIVNSQLAPNPLGDTEYDCMNNLASLLGISSNFTLGSLTYIDYCSQGVTCQGTSTKSITRINFKQYSTNIVTANLFQCFPNIESLLLSSCIFSSNFLQTVHVDKLKNVRFEDCSSDDISQIFSSPVNESLNSLTLVLRTPVIFKLNLSYINKLSGFDLGLKTFEPLSNITLINDYPEGTLGNIPFTSNFQCNNVPPMGNIIGNYIKFNMYSPPVDGFSNIATLKNFSIISIYISTGSTPFPPFNLIPVDNQIHSIYMRSQLQTNPKINLTNLPLLKLIDLRDTGTGFQINGEIPLILPTTVQSFVLSGSSLSSGIWEFFSYLPNIETVSISYNNIPLNFSKWENRNVKTLLVNNNALTGTLDSSWCSSTIDVSYNYFTGNLPTCYSCHLLSNQVSGILKSNSFSNFSPIPICTTLIPNLRLNTTANEIELYGDDLGFFGSDIEVTTPQLYFNVYTPSKLFKAILSGSLPETIELKFKGNGITYRVATSSSKQPIVSSVTPTDNGTILIFDGSFFSYNSTSIIIPVGDNNHCIVTSCTFYRIICTLSGSTLDINSKPLLTTINIQYVPELQTQSTQILVLLNQTSQVTYCTEDCASISSHCNTLTGKCQPNFCPNDCSQNGICNDLGSCICNYSYQGYDCSVHYVPCVAGCQGTCNNITGECVCDNGLQGPMCSLPIIQCPNNCTDSGSCNTFSGVCTCVAYKALPDCSGFYCNSTCENGGTCDFKQGTCKCTPNYQGSICNIPQHYIVSIIPCSIDGGEVSIYGWFGEDSDGTHTASSYNIYIGQLDCQITYINKTLVTCTLRAGIGSKNVKIINTNYANVVFEGKGIFNYYNPIKSCPNSCSGNGVCNTKTGECQCNEQYISGYDCSIKKEVLEIAPITNTTVDLEYANTVMQNQDTIYEISVLELKEITIDGVFIVHSLKNNWSLNNDGQSDNGNVFKFSQTIPNNTGIISYSIEEIKDNDKKFTFGSTSFTVIKGSIKISISISNYQYQSSLNTLQLVFYSAAVNSTKENQDNECNKQESTINTSNVDNTQPSNYIQIKKNSKSLVGRFINSAISDGRQTFISSTLIDNGNSNNEVLLGLNLPHCIVECLIDPDFSLLVSPEFKSSCNDDSRNNWFIPVVVVVPIVGLAIVISVSLVIYKKHKYTFKILKMRTFKK